MRFYPVSLYTHTREAAWPHIAPEQAEEGRKAARSLEWERTDNILHSLMTERDWQIVYGNDLKQGDGADGLLERLAEAQHEIWSNWMRWMFKQGYYQNRELMGDFQRVWTIPNIPLARWERQMKTPYAGLTEKEKESDRQVVREHLGFLLKAAHSR